MSPFPAAEGPLVLLDVRRLIWRGWTRRLPTGIDRACLAYLAHYRHRALAVVEFGRFVRVLPQRASIRLFDALLSSERMGGRSAIVRALAAAALTPSVRDVDGMLYLNVGHTGLDKPDHGQWVRRSGVRAVYCVYDLIPITHPQYCRPGADEQHRARMRTVLDEATGVISCSADALSDLGIFAASEGRSMPRSALVSHIGVDAVWEGHGDRRAPASEDGRPYFIMVGTIEGRKNHIMILRLWERLAAELGDAAPRLVIVGQRGWQSEEAIALLDNSGALGPHVTEMANCSDAELASLVSGARALLFPTYAEGFGLPLVEALALGTPAIASALPVLREIAGDVPTFLDPDDPDAWHAAILDYAKTDSPLREDKMARLRISPFRPASWVGHFEEVDAWLRTL